MISSIEPRAHWTSSIHSSSSANIRNNWSTCGIRSIALPYNTTRRVLVLQYWYSHTTSECATVKRCRYHAIRGSVLVVCTWYVSYEYGGYRTLFIDMVLLYSYRSTLASYDTWSYVSMSSTRDFTGKYCRNMTGSQFYVSFRRNTAF